MTAMIELEAVSKVHGDGRRTVNALTDVSLTVGAGEFVAVVGPSGSGKSTLLQIIGCLDVPTSGRCVIDGTDVRTLDDVALSRLRNAHVGFVFQSFNLVARTTALENVELPMCYGPDRPDRKLARAALDRVGMSHRADHFPNELSGGEQQRVAIARALVRKPALLIADEPTGNLDAATGTQILDLFSELNREGLTIILVTHDPRVAERAERTVSLGDGRIVSDISLVRVPA
jgi:putative ABC transport system ATP-binding protein